MAVALRCRRGCHFCSRAHPGRDWPLPSSAAVRRHLAPSSGLSRGSPHCPREKTSQLTMPGPSSQNEFAAIPHPEHLSCPAFRSQLGVASRKLPQTLGLGRTGS